MTQHKDEGERIAKVMARAGVASRRDAERMIVEGRVAVNGKAVTSPALDITPADRVTVDGKPIDAPQPARLWLYYKPLGLVTTERDEKGRQTVFESLPEGMPRVMSVGRLDLNSEGLLLLTNDGELKRRLELPTTGWLRKYRVRVNGRPNEATFDPLRRGITIDGEDFQPMDISLDKQQGANAWLTVGIREGRNREVRRAMSEIGLIVNRLIRVSYGPFRLNTMKPGDVVEVKQRILRDQLGEGGDKQAPTPREDGDAPRKPRAPRPEGEAPRKPRPARSFDADAPRKRGEYKPRFPREDSDAPRKPRAPRPEGEAPRKPRPARAFDADAPRQRGEYKPRFPREDGDAPRKPRTPRPEGDAPRKPRPDKGERAGQPGGPKSAGRPSSGPKPGKGGGPRGGAGGKGGPRHGR